MSATLEELKLLHHHKKRLQTENEFFRAALKEITVTYRKGTKAHKLARNALEYKSFDIKV